MSQIIVGIELPIQRDTKNIELTDFLYFTEDIHIKIIEALNILTLTSEDFKELIGLNFKKCRRTEITERNKNQDN